MVPPPSPSPASANSRLGGSKQVAVQALFGQDEAREGPAGPCFEPLLTALTDAPLTAKGKAEADMAQEERWKD